MAKTQILELLEHYDKVDCITFHHAPTAPQTWEGDIEDYVSEIYPISETFYASDGADNEDKAYNFLHQFENQFYASLHFTGTMALQRLQEYLKDHSPYAIYVSFDGRHAFHDDAIAQLPAGYGYTYLTIDGYDGDILAVTDSTYQWDNGENASLTAYLYVQNGDTVQYLGNVMTGGTGYPIRCVNGILYNCNMVQYGEMKVEQKPDGKYELVYTNRGTITNNADGTVEVETEGNLAGAEEDEIRDKIVAMDDVVVVDFTVVI